MSGPAQNQDHPRLARARAAAEAAAEAAAQEPAPEGVSRGEATAIIRDELEAAVTARAAAHAEQLRELAAGIGELRAELARIREDVDDLTARVYGEGDPGPVPELVDPAETRTGHDVAEPSPGVDAIAPEDGDGASEA